MTLSQVRDHLNSLIENYGDTPIVLFDCDTSWYFTLALENFEAQRMEDGTVRISVGVNSYRDQYEPNPTIRPL